MTKRSDIVSYLPVIFGLSETEAAAACGVSATVFREMVEAGTMPKARQIGTRKIYDVDEVRAAFKSLPVHGRKESTGWEDVV